MEISEFVKALRILAPSVFGLAILWGSAKLMTGDELMREEGKNIIKNAILGLVLALLSTCLPELLSGIKISPIVLVP